MSAQKADMTGKVCLITGASAGIGKATAMGLAKLGATVFMVSRDPERGARAHAQVVEGSGSSSVHLMLADLSSQASIRRLVQGFESRQPVLHVLLNNAATIPRHRAITEEGLERQFAVNHLSYFLLTNLLLDRLKASAPARIINVSSQAHRHAAVNFDDLQSERYYHPNLAYAMTKLANVIFTYELARKLEGTGVTANCLHPGLIGTKLLADASGLPWPLHLVTKLVGGTPAKGARTPIYLATAPEVEGVTGRYLIGRRAIPSSPCSYDREAAKRLWQVSADLSKLNVSL